MSLDLFITVCRALYGATWQTRIAEDLGVNQRTIRRWVAGENPVPASIVERLLDVCATRRAGIDRAVVKLMKIGG